MIGQEEREAVLRVMERGILSGYQGNWSDAFYGGFEVKALEQEWAEYFGVKHAIVCNSATSGLWLACVAIGLQRDLGFGFAKPTYNYIDNEEIPEIVVSPYSMTCSASIPLHFGAKPVFADIERDYYCLDPASVEAAITERTRAIIVVDLFGQPYDADAINAIAKKHHLLVIEDAAQAIGAKYKGKYAGTLGDIGVFSLNRHKHISCGEGGVVVTNNDELAFKIRLAMNHSEAVVNDMVRQDIEPQAPVFTLAGLNLRMTELQAAVAREQLKKLPAILEKVREGAGWFSEQELKVRPQCEHAFYRYAAMPKRERTVSLNLTYTPEQFSEKFNIKRHYIRPIFQMPLFRSLGYDQEQCPVCREVEDNITLAWLKDVD